MKDFLFIYRADQNAVSTGTPEQMATMTKRWMDWIAGIAAQGKLIDRGNRLTNTGHVLKPNNVVTNGPYMEIKESIGGYSLIKAASYDEAIEMARDCPGLTVGGTVEVREINPL